MSNRSVPVQSYAKEQCPIRKRKWDKLKQM
jgi:hypothetical protein